MPKHNQELKKVSSMETNLNTSELKWIIDQAEEELGKDNAVVHALKNCKSGTWDTKSYLRFAGSNSEENNTDDCVIVEHESKGTAVIDLMEDGTVLGIEIVDGNSE
jgi:hypothetical protein